MTTAAPTTTAPEPTVPETPEVPEVNKSALVEVLSCCFKSRILPTDFEYFRGHFPAEEGKVYVDLTMQIQNTGEGAIGPEDITGWFEHDGKRLDMQLELEANAGDFENEDRTIQPGETRIGHLFYNVEAAAEGTALEVHYSVLEDEAQIQVDDYVEPVLEDKIGLKLGDVYTQEGEYTIEVLKCMVSDNLQATGAGALKYYVQGYEVLDLVVRLTNEGERPIDHLEGYLVMDGQIKGAAEEQEIKENTELEALTEDSTIAPGAEAVIHIWVTVPVDTDPEGLAMRMNILDESFYCNAMA